VRRNLHSLLTLEHARNIRRINKHTQIEMRVSRYKCRLRVRILFRQSSNNSR